MVRGRQVFAFLDEGAYHFIVLIWRLVFSTSDTWEALVVKSFYNCVTDYSAIPVVDFVYIVVFAPSHPRSPTLNWRRSSDIC
jgi:hypothetical protein